MKALVLFLALAAIPAAAQTTYSNLERDTTPGHWSAAPNNTYLSTATCTLSFIPDPQNPGQNMIRLDLTNGVGSAASCILFYTGIPVQNPALTARDYRLNANLWVDPVNVTYLFSVQAEVFVDDNGGLSKLAGAARFGGYGTAIGYPLAQAWAWGDAWNSGDPFQGVGWHSDGVHSETVQTVEDTTTLDPTGRPFDAFQLHGNTYATSYALSDLFSYGNGGDVGIGSAKLDSEHTGQIQLAYAFQTNGDQPETLYLKDVTFIVQ